VMLQTPLKWLISAFFAAAMFALVVGLTFFLREVHLAMHTVRFGVPKPLPTAFARQREADRVATPG